MPYSGNPADSVADYVRFLIGDTDNTNLQFLDAEVAYIVLENGNLPFPAAIQLVGQLIARYSRRASKRVGDLSIQYGELVKNLQGLEASLVIQGASGGTIYAGGMTSSDKEVDAGNSDRIQPNFRIGMDDKISPAQPSDFGNVIRGGGT